MKPSNKIPVLEQISVEMRRVVTYQQDNLPPVPDDNDIAAQRRYYQIERQFWNEIGRASLGKACRSRWSPYH